MREVVTSPSTHPGPLPRFFDFDKLAEVTRVVTENLNKVGECPGLFVHNMPAAIP